MEFLTCPLMCQLVIIKACLVCFVVMQIVGNIPKLALLGRQTRPYFYWNARKDCPSHGNFF